MDRFVQVRKLTSEFIATIYQENDVGKNRREILT